MKYKKDTSGVNINLDNIKINPINPRSAITRIGELQNSMNSIGQISPITIDDDGYILNGHRRFIAAQKLGWSTIKADVKTGLSDFDKKAIILSANTTQQRFNSWDCREFIAKLYWDEFLDEYEPKSMRDNGYSEFSKRIGASLTTTAKILNSSKPEHKELVSDLKKNKIDVDVVDLIVAAPIERRNALKDFVKKRYLEKGKVSKGRTRELVRAYSRKLTTDRQGTMKRQQFEYLISRLEVVEIELDANTKDNMDDKQVAKVKRLVNKLYKIWK